MRVLITGSRQWHDRPAIREKLKQLQRHSLEGGEEFVVIHGACPDGADLIAHEICTSELGLVVGVDLHPVPADWPRFGKAAGPIRNQRMIDQHHPDVVYAFRSGQKSSGTDDMVTRAKRCKIETHVITPAPIQP